MSPAKRPAKAGELYTGGAVLQLDRTIGAGREGTVHALTDLPNLAAKLISPENPDPGATAHKLTVMTAAPLPAAHSRNFLIAWPTALITDRKKGGQPRGYVMPRLDGDIYRHIGSYFNPSRRRRLLEGRQSGYTYLHLLRMARNLALAVDRVHQHGALVGDLNSRNVMASDSGRIALIDTDSFQVRDPNTGKALRCLVGTPEYTSARLQGQEFSCTDRRKNDDLFALAVMLYQLLMQGGHPYSGTITGPAAREGQDLAARIADGSFAHAADAANIIPTPGAALIWEDLPLKRQFRSAFQDIRPRPSARTWATDIENAAGGLRRCAKNPRHYHFRRYCTWCRYGSRIRIEPFPAPGDTPPAGRRKKKPRAPRKRK